jgi:hypothetical protein
MKVRSAPLAPKPVRIVLRGLHEEGRSGCGGPGRCLTRQGVEYKVRPTSPSFGLLMLGVLETETDRGGAVHA